MGEMEELKKRIEKLEAKQSDEKDLITLDEAASFLGFSKDYLRRLCYRKLIPYYQPTNKSSFFLKSELMIWVRGRKKNRQCRVKKNE